MVNALIVWCTGVCVRAHAAKLYHVVLYYYQMLQDDPNEECLCTT